MVIIVHQYPGGFAEALGEVLQEDGADPVLEVEERPWRWGSEI